MPESQPRILFFDDNVRDIGGHYLELAYLLASGARSLGYRPELVAHRSLWTRNPHTRDDTRLADLQVQPDFRVRRMEHWSLGVDGRSTIRRDVTGAPDRTERASRRIWHSVTDHCRRSIRQPTEMVDSWSDTFRVQLERFRPETQDRVVINTGGDFQLLALAAGLAKADRGRPPSPLTVDVIFHFAVYDGQPDRRAFDYGRQVNETLRLMQPHRVRLHATTESLADQLCRVGVTANAIPYPTRPRPVHRRFDSIDPPTVTLAGIPRAEKGRAEIRSLLQAIDPRYLQTGRLRFALQLPSRRPERFLPDSVARSMMRSDAEDRPRPVHAMYGNLSSEAYHRWLDGADVGLFLYDPNRYVARCSGVLLEMLVRGVPVIVPDGCWMADRVRQAPVDRPIGWIYESTDQLPELLDRVIEQLPEVGENCRWYAHRVAREHSGDHCLLQMGVPAVQTGKLRVAG